MASPISTTDRKVTTLAAFERDLVRRREVVGMPDLPRNAGTRRTESKQALLQAIEATGNRW
jgi:hypothetical protein